MAAAAILVFEKFDVLTVFPHSGPICVIMPNFKKSVKRLRRYGDLTDFQNGGCPPSWILEIQIFLTLWTVKRPILRIRAKFREDLPIRCCDIAIFMVFQDGGRRLLGF